MALKITVPIGTDRGITSEAYVRISDYSISKLGYAAFKLELFQSDIDAAPNNEITPALRDKRAHSVQIGDVHRVKLLSPQQVDTIVKKYVEVEVEVEHEVTDQTDAEGAILSTKTVTFMDKQMQYQHVVEQVTMDLPDLSPLEGIDIFAYGYRHIKTKLEELFGEGNIVDC